MANNNPLIWSFPLADTTLPPQQPPRPQPASSHFSIPREKTLQVSGVDHRKGRCRLFSEFRLSDGLPIPEARGILQFFYPINP